MRITVLGCGTSSGVPVVGCTCPVCLSRDPNNHRLRASILVESRGTVVLFDSGPDVRYQMLRAGVLRIDAVVYTHAHADHIHGIDDLRQINNVLGTPLPAYADPLVFDRIRARFDYAFHADEMPGGGFWRPSLKAIPIDGPFRIGSIELVPFRQSHGKSDSWGFRIGDFAYSTDALTLDEAAFEALAGTRLWIVDALRDDPHPSHAHLARTLTWIERVGPERAWLTHMNHEVDYETWCDLLPPHVRPAHDGLVIETEDP